MSGKMIDNFTTMNERPWCPWHSIDLFHGKTDVIPWNILDAASNIFRYQDEKPYMIFGHDEWDDESLSDFVHKLLRFTLAATFVYSHLLLLLNAKHRVVHAHQPAL
jgi:hypothetical protein